MKSIVLNEFGKKNLAISEVPLPEIGDNEVLVRIKAVSLNYLDLLLVEGKFNTDLPLPYTPASDGAGIVEKTGSNVKQWKTGDRVVLQYVQNWISAPLTQSNNNVRVAWQTSGVLSEYVKAPEAFPFLPYSLQKSQERALSLRPVRI